MLLLRVYRVTLSYVSGNNFVVYIIILFTSIMKQFVFFIYTMDCYIGGTRVNVSFCILVSSYRRTIFTNVCLSHKCLENVLQKEIIFY